MTFVALVAARWSLFLAAIIPLGGSLFPLYVLGAKMAADWAHVAPTLRNVLAVAALAAAVAFSFGTTATASGWADCRGADLDLDRRIAGCSEVIAGIAKESRHRKITSYINRGTAYQGKGDYDHAIEDFTKALAFDPKSPLILSSRAAALGAKGEFDRALADYGAAIGAQPKNARLFYGRGGVYQSKSELDHAIGDYDAAIVLDKNFAAAYGARADAYRAKGDADKALADLNDAVKFDRNSARAYVNRGAFYQAKGDYEAAIKDLSEAISREPKLASARDGRGVAYHGKGDFDHAIADFNEAIKLDPKYATAYFNRAEAWRDRHGLVQAKDDLEEALRLDPQLTPARNALDDLNKLIASTSAPSGAAPSEAPAAPVAPSLAGAPASALFLGRVTARWAQFVSAMILLGGSLFRFYAEPSEVGADGERVTETMRYVAVIAAFAVAASALAWVAASIVDIAGDVGSLFDAETLSQYFFETSFGPVWLIRIVVATALPIIVLITRRRFFTQNWSTALVALLAAAVLVSQAWIGHPASLPVPERWFVIAAYAMHVLAAAVWLGALLPLGLLVRQALRDGEAQHLAEFALWRFSPVGMVAVALILAGGIVNALSRALSFDAFVASTWGRIVMLKAAIVFTMIVVAALNRFVLIPRLSSQKEITLPKLARNVAFEQAAGILILVAAAFLGVFHPPAMMGMMH